MITRKQMKKIAILQVKSLRRGLDIRGSKANDLVMLGTRYLNILDRIDEKFDITLDSDSPAEVETALEEKTQRAGKLFNTIFDFFDNILGGNDEEVEQQTENFIQSLIRDYLDIV